MIPKACATEKHAETAGFSSRCKAFHSSSDTSDDPNVTWARSRMKYGYEGNEPDEYM